VRPPEEIAADLSRLAVTWYLDLPAGAEDLLREAAEALRKVADIYAEADAPHWMTRTARAEADRGALLAWGRGMLAPPGPARDAQLAALPERLRPRLTDAILDVWTERAALSEHLRREMEQ
jgi:hypothetical protein